MATNLSGRCFEPTSTALKKTFAKALITPNGPGLKIARAHTAVIKQKQLIGDGTLTLPVYGEM